MHRTVLVAVLTLLVLCITLTAAFSQIDTLNSQSRTHVPGDVSGTTTPKQDSAYKYALAINISGRSRFEYHTRIFFDAMRASADLERKPSSWENIQRNLAIPPELLNPSPQEITQYRMNIANAQYVPGVLMWPMGTGNLQVNLGDIAAIFGLVEDVSPRIAYAIDETTEVTVVVYSASAILIRTIFNGVQKPGTYQLDWDGRSDAGKLVANGDYVAEVQLGDKRMMRKHIVWPPQ